MLKKTITYEDFNGETVSEDFFFHLSKAELIELELSHKGGLSESLQRIIEAEDGKGIIAEFKNIILGAYGQRSSDGKRFIKNQQIREEFESTEAYSALFVELVTDTDAAIDFINGVVPVGMAEEAARLASVDLKVVEEGVAVVAKPEEEDVSEPVQQVLDIGAVDKPEPVVVKASEVSSMSEGELSSLAARLKSGQAKIE